VGERGAHGGDDVVELVAVTKRYGSLAAVDDVSLSIGREFFSLLGPSGSGKTTLLRIIAGFSGIDTGRVVIAGADVTRVPPHRRPCNTVFQQYALFPHLTVAGNIAFGLKERKLPKHEIQTRVGEALELVRLVGSDKKRPDQLSGGQQQRVALARVLVNKPTVLLLDEPLAALDAKLRKGMQLELKRLQQEVGISFVYVTHDQEEALAMSDRLAVMDGGKVQQVGPPQVVYDDPVSPFVADFVGHSNLVPVEVVSVDPDGSALLQLRAGQRVQTRGLANVRRGPGLLMVRPEDVTLTNKNASGGSNQVTGQVISHMFLGSGSRVEVALADESRIVSIQDRRSTDVRWGDWVSVEWSPMSARFFPDAP
jgi:spermidine/putrescine transport system ATP-binding protein